MRTVSTSRRPLSRERILDAAVRIVDREGLAALSMRRLGADLGVEAMSLYRHVPGKTALLDGVIERVFAELQRNVDHLDWRDAFRSLAHSFLELMRRHPHAIPLVSGVVLTNPAVLGPAGSGMATLRRAGFNAETSLRVLCTVVSFVIGYALWESGTTELRAAERARAAASLPGPSLPADVDPYIAALAPQLAAMDPEASFAYGLDVIVRGLEAKLL